MELESNDETIDDHRATPADLFSPDLGKKARAKWKQVKAFDWSDPFERPMTEPERAAEQYLIEERKRREAEAKKKDESEDQPVVLRKGPDAARMALMGELMSERTKMIKEMKHHPWSIFSKFPAIGTASLSSGAICATPYQNYDCDTLIIWGSADASWVSERMFGPWVPLLGTDGKAQVSIRVTSYRDTVVNAYKECSISFAAMHKSRTGPSSSSHFMRPKSH